MEPKESPIRHIPMNMKMVTAVVLACAPVPTTEGAMNRVKLPPKAAIAIVVHSCCLRRPYLSANHPETGIKSAKPMIEMS
jgi:hypothetical protein